MLWLTWAAATGKYASQRRRLVRVRLVLHSIPLSASWVSLTCHDSGIDLDADLVSTCAAYAAALPHTHLLKFFTADILEVDTMAVVREFAGLDCDVVVAMYFTFLLSAEVWQFTLASSSRLHVPVARRSAQARPPHTRQQAPLRLCESCGSPR
jgi:hypothetical protein